MYLNNTVQIHSLAWPGCKISERYAVFTLYNFVMYSMKDDNVKE